MGRTATPPNWHTVTPRIVARDAPRLVEFLSYVFGATGQFDLSSPCVLTIGDSHIMVSEAGAREPMSGFLYVYVADVDSAYRRAVERGAKSIEEPFDTPYGDRRCMIQDLWGNMWQIAVYRGSQSAA
jgi:uncharacterized glyoxalase superfamily protein PhnB